MWIVSKFKSSICELHCSSCRYARLCYNVTIKLTLVSTNYRDPPGGDCGNMGRSRFLAKRRLCDWTVFVRRGIILIQREVPLRSPAIPPGGTASTPRNHCGSQVPNPPTLENHATGIVRGEQLNIYINRTSR